jgi:hypothetical protein
MGRSGRNYIHAARLLCVCHFFAPKAKSEAAARWQMFVAEAED